jgi:hypothetical protein
VHNAQSETDLKQSLQPVVLPLRKYRFVAENKLPPLDL